MKLTMDNQRDTTEYKNKVICGDCLEVMKEIPDKSVDMILADLPYGTTACKWDTIIPFEPLWEQYKRIIKDNGAIVLTANNPFASRLVCSNLEMYRYEWIWDKVRGYNFQQANFAPMKNHEQILIFSKSPAIYNKKGTCNYFPQKTEIHIKHKSGTPTKTDNLRDGASTLIKPLNIEHEGFFPLSIQKFPKEKKSLHPTQKPVALFEYLIKTYTNEGDIVLDNVAGSFTTAIASENLKRNWICIEKEKEYCEIGLKRINENREKLGILDKCDIIDIWQ
jgi:site-specific DNA-methyltransferase (adenine-specific)